MKVVDAVRRYPLFALAPSPLVCAWIEQGHTLRLKAGETIFQQGSPGEWGYLIRKGRVRVVRQAPSDRELSLGVLTSGELFGEYALLPPTLNTATCRAASDVDLWQFPLAPVRAWLQATPSVRMSVKSWMQLNFLVRHLRKQAFLGFMSATSALAMEPHLETLVVPAIRTLQAEGLGEDRWFFLEEGEVALNDGDEEVRSLVAGSCFGERALIGSRTLPTAVAVTAVRCLTLPREYFVKPDLPSGSRQSTCADVRNWAPKGVRWIGQKEASDCGAASLAMVAGYFNLPVAENEVRSQVSAGPGGVSLLELRAAAQRLGLAGQAVRITREQVGYLQAPAIAYLDPGHYVVLFHLDHGGILMGDPATGLVKISFPHFLERFTGHLLLLHPASTHRTAL